MRRALKAYPTLLKVGVAEVFAYRAEFLVWLLTSTLPLIMLALWSAVSAEGPFGRFGQSDFVAYYLAILIVRMLTGNWVVWQMNEEIRTGTLSLRLLRPIHPFVAYSAEHLAAIPFRVLVSLPLAVVLLLTAGAGHVVSDPVQVAVFVAALVGAWLLMFLTFLILGTLGLFLERSLALFQVWLGLFFVFSGYMIPVELLPGWLQTVSRWTPFRYQLGFPVEVLIGLSSRAAALRELAFQWGFVVVLGAVLALVWRGGLRRFEAYGA